MFVSQNQFGSENLRPCIYCSSPCCWRRNTICLCLFLFFPFLVQNGGGYSSSIGTDCYENMTVHGKEVEYKLNSTIREETKLFRLPSLLKETSMAINLAVTYVSLEIDLEISIQAVPEKNSCFVREKALRTSRHFKHSKLDNSRGKCMAKPRESKYITLGISTRSPSVRVYMLRKTTTTFLMRFSRIGNDCSVA